MHHAHSAATGTNRHGDRCHRSASRASLCGGRRQDGLVGGEHRGDHTGRVGAGPGIGHGRDRGEWPGGPFRRRLGVEPLGQQHDTTGGRRVCQGGFESERGHLRKIGRSAQREGQAAEFGRRPADPRLFARRRADRFEQSALGTTVGDRSVPGLEIGRHVTRCPTHAGAGGTGLPGGVFLMEGDLRCPDQEHIAMREQTLPFDGFASQQRAVTALEIPDHPALLRREDLSVEAAGPLVMDHDLVGRSPAQRDPLTCDERHEAAASYGIVDTQAGRGDGGRHGCGGPMAEQA